MCPTVSKSVFGQFVSDKRTSVNWRNSFTDHASNGDDVFRSSAVQVVEPGVIGRVVGAGQGLLHLAQSRKRLRVLHGLGRKDGDLVAVDLDRPLCRRRPFSELQPTFDVRRTPDNLELVFLQQDVVFQLEIRLADLVELFVRVRQDSEGGLEAAGVSEEVEEEEEVFAFATSEDADDGRHAVSFHRLDRSKETRHRSNVIKEIVLFEKVLK